MPESHAKNAARMRKIRADAKTTAQKIIALSLPSRSGVISIDDRKNILSQLAQLPPDHPDPIKAITELNRMEHVYDVVPSTNGNTYNQVILQGFTIEELRLLVQNKLSVKGL